VIVHNLDFEGVAFAPNETDPPLVINAYAELPLPFAFQGLQPVPWQARQRSQVRRCVEHVQFPKSLPFDRFESPHRLPMEKALCVVAAEGPDHSSRLYCFSLTVKQ
jgi:hypothetical protein